jgi:hypothetical protein
MKARLRRQSTRWWAVKLGWTVALVVALFVASTRVVGVLLIVGSLSLGYLENWYDRPRPRWAQRLKSAWVLRDADRKGG